MMLARLARRRGALSRLGAGVERLAGGAWPGQLDAGGGASLLETAAPGHGPATECRPFRVRCQPARLFSSSAGSSSGSGSGGSGSGGSGSGSKQLSPGTWFSRQLTARIQEAASREDVLQLFAAEQRLELNPVAVTRTVYAAGALRYRFTQLQQAVWEHHLARALSDASLRPQNVSNSLWGWGKLRLLLSPHLAATADAALQRAAAGMTPQEAANTLWAYASNGWQLSDAAAVALQQRLKAALPEAGPQTVANSLWALAKLGAPLHAPLAAAAEAAVQPNAASMKPQEVSNTRWAYATGGRQLSSAAAAAALLLRLEAVLPEADRQAVANSLWAIAKLGLPLEGTLAVAVEAAVQRTAASMKSQEVGNTLWAYATSGWQLGSAAAAAALLQRLEAVLPEAEPQHVSNCLWAIAKLGLPLEGTLAVAADAAVQRTVPAMTSQNVSNTLWAYATSGWQLGDTAAALLQQRLEAVLPEAKPQEIANSLWALEKRLQRQGQPAILSPTLPNAVIAWADTRWPQLPALWVCDLCFYLARLGVQPGRAWIGAAVARCLACIEAGDVARARLSNLVWACSKWEHGLRPEALTPLIAASVDSVAAEWENRGRLGGVWLLKALARQPGGFSLATAPPAAAAALEQRLLPLICRDIELVASLAPQGGELAYLADCAASCAVVGLRLPPAQLESIQRFAVQHPQQLDGSSRAELQRAFEAWDYQPGLALLAQQAAGA